MNPCKPTNSSAYAHQATATSPPVIVIDEVGKMEMFSNTFAQMVRSLVSRGNTTILATIPIPKGRPIALVEELRSSKDAQVFEVRKGIN